MTSLLITHVSRSPVTQAGRLQQETYYNPYPVEITLSLGKLDLSDQGQILRLVESKSLEENKKILSYHINLPHSGGLHIVVSASESSSRPLFTYTLILVLGKRQSSGSLGGSKLDTVSIDFPGPLPRNIRVSEYAKNTRRKLTFANPFALFYIPLEGARKISNNLIDIAQTSANEIKTSHGIVSTGNDMDSEVILYMVYRIMGELTPPNVASLDIQGPALRAFNRDELWSLGPGRFFQLEDGGWKEFY